ncbi:MAG: lycopene beta-cyclase [Myxococcota bacterium]|jgi:lycopene beta-cyclase
MSSASEQDYILVGGGLQNGLIALAVLDQQPDARLVLVEAGQSLGGNHTWSFHPGYRPDGTGRWLDPLVEHSWPRYRVQFPGLTRVLEEPYATMSSSHFHSVVSTRIDAAPNATMMLGAFAMEVHPNSVVLADGTILRGRLVVDARGPDAGLQSDDTGYQKFVGLEVELAAPISVDTAELMDANVEQLDGFRFVYVLPFSPTRALIEDTYFSESSTLDVDAVRERVYAYAAASGLEIVRVIREESGVLPMPWRAAGPIQREAPFVAGFQGGWFHPATGYSVPVAMRVAHHIAKHGPEDVFGEAFAALADDHEKQAHFAYLLNELLFTAGKPGQRWRVFEHFYALPEDLVLRFYGLAMTRADRLKMFFRRPPKGVSFFKAMKILPAWAAPWGKG